MILLALAAAVAVAQPPAAPPEPTEAERREIAEDAARDLKDSRFYNKPGASRADYDAAWQDCRLIARGSMLPGRYHYYVISKDVSTAITGNLIAGVFNTLTDVVKQGEVRRSNRRECLLTKGWREVNVDADGRKLIDGMSDAERQSFFSFVVGAHDLQGLSTIGWSNGFAQPQLAPEFDQ